MRYPINTGKYRHTRPTRQIHLKGLVAGGVIAAALGLATAAQSPDSRSDARAPGTGSAQNTPSDTAPGSASPTTSSPGTYSPGIPPTGATSGPTMDTSLTGTVSNAAGDLPPNVTPGWKIRVCSERTKVDNLTFRISQVGSADRSGRATGKPYGSKTTADQAESRQGTAGGTAAGNAGAASDASSMVQQTAIWSRGSASEISVPTALREADRIRIEAIGQDDKDAHVCVLYNDHVARKMNFEAREVATLRKTENGECGC